jgi:hypothetical protein
VSLKPYQRIPLLVLGMLSLLTALWGGTQRLGWDLPVLTGSLALNHGPLMVGAFLGTVIGLERAVALDRLWGYLAPALTGLGGLALISGQAPSAALFLLLSGSLVLVGVNLVFTSRWFAWFHVVMGLGAIALVVGNLFLARGEPVSVAVWWWMGFLLLTITGERMELGRLLFLSKTQQWQILLFVFVTVAGLVLSLLKLDLGVRVLGIGMIAIALWLGNFDVARRTVRQTGLTRFIAVNLLLGYAWLALSGVLLVLFGADFGGLRYDAVLHAFFLGYVFSMIFGHAPVIFPAILGRGMSYRPAFYLHVILLHLFLAIRIGGDLTTQIMPRHWGGLFNTLTLLVFLANTLLSMRAYTLAKNRSETL